MGKCNEWGGTTKPCIKIPVVFTTETKHRLMVKVTSRCNRALLAVQKGKVKGIRAVKHPKRGADKEPVAAGRCAAGFRTAH